MAAVFAPASHVAEALDEHNAPPAVVGLCIAADNGAHQVISGPAAEVAAILERLEATGIRVARLRRSPAYHSAMIEPALDDLEEALARFCLRATVASLRPAISPGGRSGSGDALDAAYWRRQIARAGGVSRLRRNLGGAGCGRGRGDRSARGARARRPRSPGPSRRGLPSRPWRCRASSGPDATFPQRRRRTAFFAAVAGAYEAGLPLRFDGLFAGESRRRISLPGYPFRRDRHWIDAPRRRRSSADHPILGSRPRVRQRRDQFRHRGCFPPIRHGSPTTACSAAWWRPARSMARWRHRPAPPRAPAPTVIDDFQMRKALSSRRGGTRTVAGRRVVGSNCC